MLSHPRDARLNLNPLPERISYWLLPEASEFEHWQRVIYELAAEYDGPWFEPHVTVFWGPYTPLDSADETLEKVCTAIEPIHFETEGLEFTDLFTKSCFLTLKENPDVLGAYTLLRRAMTDPSDFELRPHMSLFYGALTAQMREEIRERVNLPRTICCDRIWAVSTTPTVTNQNDVLQWRLACEGSCRK